LISVAVASCNGSLNTEDASLCLFSGEGGHWMGGVLALRCWFVLFLGVLLQAGNVIRRQILSEEFEAAGGCGCTDLWVAEISKHSMTLDIIKL
jgi:hypothetical protein